MLMMVVMGSGDMYIVELNYLNDQWANCYHDTALGKQPAIFSNKCDALQFMKNMQQGCPRAKYRIATGVFQTASIVYTTEWEEDNKQE